MTEVDETDARMGGSGTQCPDRREAMLTVASRYFLDHGYAGTTMSAIAAAIGGSKATLLKYFPSKENLFAACIDYETAAFRAQLSNLLDTHGPLEQTLKRFCEQFLKKVTSPDAIALHRLVVAEAGRFPEMGDIFYSRAPRMTQGILGEFLARSLTPEKLPGGDPVMAARQLLALCMSSTHQQMLLGLADIATDERIEADAEMAIRTFLRATT
jgi:AcrR family transcriptional regulator